MTADACTCFWTPESMWFRHFGAVEPGSQREWNPDCPEHGDTSATEAGDPTAWRDAPIRDSYCCGGGANPGGHEWNCDKLRAWQEQTKPQPPTPTPTWLTDLIDYFDQKARRAVAPMFAPLVDPMLIENGIRVRAELWVPGDAEDQDDDPGGRYEGDLGAVSLALALESADADDLKDAAALGKYLDDSMAESLKTPIYDDVIFAQQRYLDETGGPDRICFFCLEPRSRCQQPDSYHARMNAAICEKFDETFMRPIDADVIYGRAPVTVSDEALNDAPDLLTVVTKQQERALIEQHMRSEAEWLGNTAELPGMWEPADFIDTREPHPVSREDRQGTYCEDYDADGCSVDVCPQGCYLAIAQREREAAVVEDQGDDDPVNHPSHYNQGPPCKGCGRCELHPEGMCGGDCGGCLDPREMGD